MKTYFERPTQVKFIDPEDNEMNNWLGGIAFQCFVICGCCGGILELHDLKESYIDEGKNPDNYFFVYDRWLNISEEIIGE